MDQIYLLEFTTVSEDSDILSHKNGSLLSLLCLIIGKVYDISKILMVRAHIDKVNSKSATFFIHFAQTITKRSSAFSVQSVQLYIMTSQLPYLASVVPLGFFNGFS